MKTKNTQNYEFLIPVTSITELHKVLGFLNEDLGIDYTVDGYDPDDMISEMEKYVEKFYSNPDYEPEIDYDESEKYPNKIYVMIYGETDELLIDNFTDLILIETGDILGQVEGDPELKENVVEYDNFLKISNIKELLK